MNNFAKPFRDAAKGVKKKELEEMYSTAGHFTYGMGSPVDEFAGFVERSKYQGLKNVKPPRKRLKIRFKR